MDYVWWQDSEGNLFSFFFLTIHSFHCFFSFLNSGWMFAHQVIGTWEEVLSMCERGHLQPQVLFYEATNWMISGLVIVVEEWEVYA